MLVCFITETGLVKVYLRDLPDKCCPLFRLEESLFVPRELIDLYLQPKFTLQEYEKGKELSSSPLSGFTSIVEITQQAAPGMRIIVSGSAGVGKSAFSSHVTRRWCHCQTLNKYKLLYLLLPRYIHRHTEPIERIICTDLNLHDTSAEAEMGRAIKQSAENMAFIIDGYDEVIGRDQRVSSLNDVISGSVAKESKVVITTRPHCVDKLAKLCQGSYVLVTLQGLTSNASEEYITKMCATEGKSKDRQLAAQQILAHIPEEARHVPLLLNMAVLIYKWNRQYPTESTDFPRIRTVSDVIGRVIAMFLSLQEEKDEGLDTVPVYLSPLDTNSPKAQIIKQFAKMCFDSIKSNNFEFTSEILDRFSFRENKILGQLGFLEITNDDEGNVASARCMHNQIMEYCAAMHVVEEPTALQYIVNTYSSAQYKIMSERLQFWQDTLIFAVGLNPDVLSTISRSNFSLRVSCQKIKNFDRHARYKSLDLSFEARLVHETQSTEAREEFCKALMTAPLCKTTRPEVIHVVIVR